MTEIQCSRCRVWVREDRIDLPNRCPEAICPLNRMDQMNDPQVRHVAPVKQGSKENVSTRT